MSYKSDFKKKQFLSEFPLHDCNITKTCDAIGITRQCFYQWLDLDDVFNQRFNYYANKHLDDAEEVVINHIKNQNLKAAMFLLTTKGKHLGYTTKQTIEAIQKKDIVFSFEPVQDKKQLPAGNDNQIIDIDHEDIPE